MIGYHYTSALNYKLIREEGLRPYTIYKEALEQHFAAGIVDGIWVWTDLLGGVSHVGSIIYQVASKSSIDIVLLEVDVDDDDLLYAPFTRQIIVMHHTGTLNDFVYHTGIEKAVIATRLIPPSKIKLIREFNLGEMMKIYEGIGTDRNLIRG